MSNSFDVDVGSRSRRLRVDTLVRLRWLAVLGQTAALVVTFFALGFPVPVAVCAIVIAMSAFLNIYLRLRFGHTDRLDVAAAAWTIGYDILQLSVLLHLTGGIENPFSVLFLAPVMISAFSLPGGLTAALTLLTMAAATLLTFWHYPVPWFPGEALQVPFLYSAGMWIALVLGAGFTAIYAGRVAEESRKLADALAATELVIAREQHLTQLDGLAAAAAHELGTPLATITLVVKELTKLLPAEGEIGEDLALLSQEVLRCRAILGKLTSLDDSEDILDEMSIGLLLEEVVQPQRDFGVRIGVDKEGQGREPVCRRNPALLYGLGNLVENAIDFAAGEVRIKAAWNAAIVAVTIEDDGPGFSADVVTRLGDPYVTTKTSRRAKIEEGSGLGLGLFIAKTLLERSGAEVLTANVPPPDHGARITIRWSRSSFERGRRQGPVDTRRALIE